MGSPHLLTVNDSALAYDVVEEGLASAKVVVFIEMDYDELLVSYEGNELLITVFSPSCLREERLRIELRRRIKSVECRVKNGIAALRVKYKLLPFL